MTSLLQLNKLIFLTFFFILLLSKSVLPADAEDIVKQYEILLGELEKYNPELLDKERILAISKSDMLDEELKEEIAIGLPKDLSSLFISSVTQQGITEMKDLIWKKLNS